MACAFCGRGVLRCADIIMHKNVFTGEEDTMSMCVTCHARWLAAYNRELKNQG